MIPRVALAASCLIPLGSLITWSSFCGSVWFLRYHSLHLAPLPLDVVGCAEKGEELVELPEGDVEGLEMFIHFHLSCSRQASQDAGDEE